MPIICQLCNQPFDKQINNKHLKYKHNITTIEYKARFGIDSLSSPEYRAERSRNASGTNNPMFGKTHSDSAKHAISNKNHGKTPHNKGKKLTDPTVLETIREAMIKREESYRTNQNHPRLNTRLSAESKDKISKGLIKYAKNNKQELQNRAQKILGTKRQKDFDFGSPMRGKHHSEKTKAILSEKTTKLGLKRRQETLTKYIKVLEEANIEIIQFNQDTVELFCKTCSTSFVKTRQYLHASKYTIKICKVCYPPPIKSQEELEILDFVQSITNLKVLSGNRSTITPLELDIYIPDLNLAIEYCGLYWHSDLAGKSKSYHYGKYAECVNKGIRLITIFEDEWVNQKDLVKSRISRIISNEIYKIHARKCEVQLISNKLARKFCVNNHIQGAGLTKHALGLFYNGELVSVMTFAKPSLAKGYKKSLDSHWELTRFCSKSNTVIIGGGSKLFKKFIQLYDPTEVLSYADLRWNTGRIYDILGFIYSGRTPPNYWYFQLPSIKRIHRFVLRKNKLDDKSKTEWENRQVQGWNRIWDCGNDKWIWSKK